MNETYAQDVKIFKAFCDEKRLAILELLKSGEKCACVLMEDMNISQSALSYHMKILCESGIVKPRQEGKWTHYSLCEDGRKLAQERLLVRTTPNTIMKQQCCK
ncbi:ArsR/SmtB family transcription factor [Amedibacillus sp. YH-ame10]